MMSSLTGMAQGRRNLPCRAYNNDYGPGTCLAVLTDLTDEQKTKIAGLEEAHQAAMAGLREKQRSTFEPAEKNAVRDEMLQKVKAHRDEVRNLLTENQQKQYDMLHARNGFHARRFSADRDGGRRQRGAGRYGFRGGW